MYVSAGGSTSFQESNSTLNDAPQGSVAVINISGAIMKHDNCGAYGTESYGKMVRQADNNPNISAIVINMDSPGGSVNGTEGLASIVKATKKPVVVQVNGYMASAAYWIGSQAAEIYANNKTDYIGSIGTMASFADAVKMWEDKGVKFHEIYATKSKHKNKDFTEARAGNYDKVIKSLDEINEVFLASVQEARGERLDASDTLSGKMFIAADAVSNGLIDGIQTLDATIARAFELANQQSTTNNSNINQNQNQTTMKTKSAWVAMTTFLAAAFSGFKAEDTAITEEHLESMNAELEAAATTKKELATATASVTSLNAEKETLTASLATANAEKETLTTDLAAANAEVTRLGALSPGATNVPKTGADATGAGADADESETDAEVKALRAELGMD